MLGIDGFNLIALDNPGEPTGCIGTLGLSGVVGSEEDLL